MGRSKAMDIPTIPKLCKGGVIKGTFGFHPDGPELVLPFQTENRQRWEEIRKTLEKSVHK